ncbi:MAG: GNAT family N-acetyltransferase [Nitrososphaerales archaeon]
MSRFLYPETFCNFRLQKKLIAKALLGYVDGEMEKNAPTIIMMEVLKEYQNKGFGTKILKWIETDATKQGFDRIWASDTQSLYFWKKRGYEIDIDEGVKYL